MNIYIMRHAEAALNAPSDAVRPLTTQGNQQALDAANWLAEQLNHHLVTEIDRLLVSPYLRAEQTAAIVQKKVTCRTIEIMPQLTPAGSENEIAAYLNTLLYEGMASVLIISHLPLVGYLAERLLHQTSALMFAPSQIVEIDFPLGLLRASYPSID